METKDDGEEEEKQKEKHDCKRMKLFVLGQRGGPSTPSASWRLHFSSTSDNCSTFPIQDSVSARKLCANLWEMLPHLQPITPKLTPYSKNKKKKKKKKPFELHPPKKLPEQVERLNAAESPTKSFKARVGESSCSRKTSSELLRVIDRIWRLQEKQSCNVSLLKSLKSELNRSHSQIKELLKEKQSNKHEMNSLMQRVAEDKASKKNKEQERVKALIQSARAELVGERKLRKHSESLHRKLAREISDVKSAFSNALKELERERKARTLLENLCDEFAKGIRDYEQEVRSLRHNRVSRGKPDRLILHISEAWLDERMQTMLEESQQNDDVTGKNTILDKLSPDIETFLQARHYPRRESFPLNEAASAPQNAPDGEETIDSDLHCFENTSATRKRNVGRSIAFNEGMMDSDAKNKMTGSRENRKGHMLAGSRSWFNSNEGIPDNTNRNQSVSSEGDRIHPEDNINEGSSVQYPNQASQMQKWKSKLASPEFDKAESLLQLPEGVKENTLKAKLLEARLESRKNRATATAGTGTGTSKASLRDESTSTRHM